ncbi:A24 family peptidase [Vibrio sp. J1-1]|uniref:A24 family peptidase n=1 Tax=Vibrio sp. J1-1 TaxID=2912251 RepID=UPI001F410E4D|nr:A24 family peptidase [Vibrio sp. J1-1]MCF7481311.1 A24 family peptidase [Vibrio sp. J1-1]
MLTVVLWSVLFVIGVSDAQRHRIPNQLVGVLFLVVVVNLYLESDVEWMIHLKGLLVTFTTCFLLYLVRVMAGGDVKLLAAIGFWLGAETMWQVTPYIVIAGGIIGVFYLALHLASSVEPIGQQVKAYAVQKVTPGWKNKQPLVIPFAPTIVIGLAYYFYIQ